MKSVDGEGFTALCGFGVELKGWIEEIYELDAISIGNFAHGFGVETNVFIVGGWIRKVWIPMFFVCDGGKEDDAGWFFAGVIFCGGFFEKIVEVGAEFFQTVFALEGFVETEE